MKFKLDENLGNRTQHIFRAEGHDVETALNEQLGSAPDEYIYEVCLNEGRCLITLDHDFTNAIKYPPAPTQGIVVFRVPRNPDVPLLERLARQFLLTLGQQSIAGQLWIVQVGRIRKFGTNGMDKS